MRALRKHCIVHHIVFGRLSTAGGALTDAGRGPIQEWCGGRHSSMGRSISTLVGRAGAPCTLPWALEVVRADGNCELRPSLPWMRCERRAAECTIRIVTNA
jgi:hypothetical protein